MIKIKLTKSGSNLSVLIPPELVAKLFLREGDEVELYEISPGVLVLAKKEIIAGELKKKVEEKISLSAPIVSQQTILSQEELAVLRKLDSFPFSKRVPENVDKNLNPVEKKVLRGIIEKNFVSVFKSEKYREGVYNIADSVYPLLKNQRNKTISSSQPTAPRSLPSDRRLPPEEFLDKYGYLIVENENEAKNISLKLEKKIKACEILGTRGFDRKYYVASKQFYGALHDLLVSSLRKKSMSVQELADSLSYTSDAISVALKLMGNDGEVAEKKKGVYELVE